MTNERPLSAEHADFLMQSEHMSRKQRIQRVQAITRRRRRPFHRSVDYAKAAEQAAATWKASAEKTTIFLTRAGSRSEEKFQEKIVLQNLNEIASKVKNTTNLSTETRGSKYSAPELAAAVVANAGRIVAKKQREWRQLFGSAKRHYRRAISFKILRSWASVIQITKLQTIKAERHHHYYVMHQIWISLTQNIQLSRAMKNIQLERIAASLREREAWRRWKYHQHQLARASCRVRAAKDFSLTHQYFNNWTTTWMYRALQRARIAQIARRKGRRAKESRFFHSWKAAVERRQKAALLAEERFLTWRQVRVWITPLGSSPTAAFTEGESTAPPDGRRY